MDGGQKHRVKPAGAPKSCPPVPSSLWCVGFHLDFRLSAHGKDGCLWIIEKPILRNRGSSATHLSSAISAKKATHIPERLRNTCFPEKVRFQKPPL